MKYPTPIQTHQSRLTHFVISSSGKMARYISILIGKCASFRVSCSYRTPPTSTNNSHLFSSIAGSGIGNLWHVFLAVIKETNIITSAQIVEP